MINGILTFFFQLETYGWDQPTNKIPVQWCRISLHQSPWEKSGMPECSIALLTNEEPVLHVFEKRFQHQYKAPLYPAQMVMLSMGNSEKIHHQTLVQTFSRKKQFRALKWMTHFWIQRGKVVNIAAILSLQKTCTKDF